MGEKVKKVSNNTIIDMYGLNSILSKLSIGKNFSEYEKYKILQYFIDKKFDYTQAYGIINGANRLYNLKKNDNKPVDFVKYLLEKSNAEYFKLMDAVGARLASQYYKKGIKTEQIDETIEEMIKAIKSATGSIDEEIVDVTKDEVQMLYALSCIYNVVSKYAVEQGLDNDKKDIEKVAKDIVLNKFMKLDGVASSITLERAEELRKLFEAMTAENNFEKKYNVFKPTEIAKLINKTTSLLKDMTVHKFKAVKDVLNEYLKNIESLVVTEEEKSLLSKTTAKNIMLKVGSILREHVDNIRLATGLFSGNTFAETFGQQLEERDTARDNYCLKLQAVFPDMRIQGMNVKNQLTLLNDTGTLLLRVTASYSYTLASNVTKAVYNALDLPEEKNIVKKKNAIENLGFSVDNMLHVDNFSDLFLNTYFSKQENCKNFEENVRFMCKITRLENVQNIFTHNFTILSQDNKKLQADIISIAKKCNGDAEETRKQVNKYLNMRVTPTSNTAQTSKEVKRGGGKRIGLERLAIDIDINVSAIYQPETKENISKSKTEDKKTSSKKTKEESKEKIEEENELEVEDIVEDLKKANEKVSYTEIENEFFLIQEALAGAYTFADSIDTENENDCRNMLLQAFANTPNNSLAKTIYGILLNSITPKAVNRNINLFIKKLNNYEGDLIYLKNTFNTSIIEEIEMIIDIIRDKNKVLEKETGDFYKEEHINKEYRGKKLEELNQFESVVSQAAKYPNNSLLAKAFNDDLLLNAYIQREELEEFATKRGKMPGKIRVIERNNKYISSMSKINSALEEVLDGIEEDREIVWVDLEQSTTSTKELEDEIKHIKDVIASKKTTLKRAYSRHIDDIAENKFGKNVLAKIAKLEEKLKELEARLANTKGTTI